MARTVAQGHVASAWTTYLKNMFTCWSVRLTANSASMALGTHCAISVSGEGAVVLGANTNTSFCTTQGIALSTEDS